MKLLSALILSYSLSHFINDNYINFFVFFFSYLDIVVNSEKSAHK